MPPTAQNHLYLRIFLASPSDVAYERSLALKLLEAIPYNPSFRGKVTFEVVAWDKPSAGTPMLATMTPQMAIAEGLSKPSDSDIVVVVIWSRMGTPLPIDECQKSDGSAYLSGTEWEYLDALAAAKQQPGHPDIVVYRRTEKVLLDPTDPKFEEMLVQHRRVEAFFASFHNSDGSIRAGYNEYAHPDDFRELLNHHLSDLIQRRLNKIDPGAALSPSPAELPLWLGSPFPGLRAFMPDDQPIFFGRGREADELVQKLRDNCCFVAVVGASGSGKSSLVGAGLLPRLRDNAVEGSKDWLLPWTRSTLSDQRKLWTGLRFTPGELGSDPFLALANCLIPLLPDQNLNPHKLALLLTTQPQAVIECVFTALRKRPDWALALIFIDQFEELFTVVNAVHVQPFINLLDIMMQTGRVRFVLTVRADFYPNCVTIPQLAEWLRTGSFPLAAPRIGTLRQMIVDPAARAGLKFEDDLPERILDDTGTNPGALALLAFALHELYKAKREDGLLSLAAYVQTGTVLHAIGKRAEDAYQRLSIEVQERLEDVFRELVDAYENGTATRRRPLRSKLEANEDSKALVNAFTEARLLVTDSTATGEAVIEVAHEALFREWERLSKWIDERRDQLLLRKRLERDALEWQSQGYPSDYRWPDSLALQAGAMLKNLPYEPSPLEAHFLGPVQYEAMLQLINEHGTPPATRAIIGRRLALIGDKRDGVGTHDGKPDIQWCQVPAGQVILKIKNKEGRLIGRIFEVCACEISKYPITQKQFQLFVNAEDGFANPVWWKDLPRFDLKPGPQHPLYDNYPVTNVSWIEATAYCRWLSSQFDREVRLPTEWEWQQAATSARADFNYPWGIEYRSGHANIDEASGGVGDSNLQGVTAVGLYPQGNSLQDVADLSGNVWEWCFNCYDEPTNTLTSETSRRVKRGGSWSRDLDGVTAFFRNDYEPEGRRYSLGFRVLCVTNSK